MLTVPRTPKGKRLYRAFFQRNPAQAEKVHIPALPKAGLAIGHVHGIIYESDRGGADNLYHHRFRKGSRPLLVVSHDGKQLILLGGAYRFTGRGIVDK